MSFFSMTGIILKSLFSKPATLMHPFIKRNYFTGTRGQIQIDIQQCIYCGICSKKCPTYAITVSREKKEWSIERLSCITCNLCVEVCPKKCLKMQNNYSASALKRKIETHKI